MVSFDPPPEELGAPSGVVSQFFGPDTPLPEAQRVRLAALSRGHSGAVVLSAVVDRPYMPQHHLLKCGPKAVIDQELAARIRYASTSLPNSAPVHDTAQALEFKGRQWSGFRFDVAGNLVQPNALQALSRSVRENHDPRAWEPTFIALYSRLQPAYGQPDGVGSPFRDTLTAGEARFGTTAATVHAVASHLMPGAHGAPWNEVAGLVGAWQEILERLEPQGTHVERRVVHGDLHSGNILLEHPIRTPFLIDFGSLGPGLPMMDLARLEMDLLFHESVLPKEEVSRVHCALCSKYLDDDWAGDSLPILRILHSLRTAFAGLIEPGGRLAFEKYSFARILEARRMLSWSDPKASNEECQRHVLWFLVEGTTRLRASLEGRPHEIRPIPAATETAVLSDAKKLGIQRVYYTGEWEARNAAKRRILADEGSVYLVAHSADSFLNPQTNRFRNDVMRRIENGREMHIVTMSPYTEWGLQSALQELGWAPGQPFDIEALADAPLFRKFDNCIREYMNLTRTANGGLKLRVSLYPVGVSMLLGTKEAFVEPYGCGLMSRRHEELQTFPEVQLAQRVATLSGPLDNVRELVRWYWETSLEVSEYRGCKEDVLKQTAQARLNVWAPPVP